MADQKRGDQANASTENENSKNQAGDPGRTPGAAEGDRQTVEEDLRSKEREDKI